MNIKRSILFFLTLFISYWLFAQVNTYIIEPRTTQQIPISLTGYDYRCMNVKLRIDVSFQEQNGTLTLVLNNMYEKPLNKKDQYTHLWLPVSSKSDYIFSTNIDQQFHRSFGSTVKISKNIKEQITYSGSSKLTLDPFIVCTNGQIIDQWDSDFLFSLQEMQPLTIHIKIQDENKPVEVKFHNIVPLQAKKDFSTPHNKVLLAYIANDIPLAFKVPTSECFSLQDQINKFKELNENLKKDYEKLLNCMILKKNSPNTKEYKDCDIQRLKLYFKYNKAYQEIDETLCEDLAFEYKEFNQYYHKICENLITPDSIAKMNAEMDKLMEDLSTAINTSNNKKCEQLLPQIVKFQNVPIKRNMYYDPSDPQVMQANETVEYFHMTLGELGKLRCTKSEGQCNINTQKIIDATKNINNLWNEFVKTKNKNSEKLNTITSDIDNYLNRFPSSCLKNKKYNKIIQQYLNAKNAYMEIIR